MASENARLPPELLLLVAEKLEPDKPTIALPASDSITIALRSLMLSCRLLYPTALHHLFTYCLHINSSDRLRLLLTALALESLPSLQARRPALRSLLISLFLAPFAGPGIDDFPIAHWTCELLSLARYSLRHLVVDIPFRSLQPVDDHLGVISLLRTAFEQPTLLEDFVCVRDELCLWYDDYDNFVYPNRPAYLTNPSISFPAWSRWPRLRRLALYNVDADVNSFWHAIARLPHLDTLVLTRADGLRRTLTVDSSDLRRRTTQAPLRIILVDASSRRDQFGFNVTVNNSNHDGNDGGEGGVVQVRGKNVPVVAYTDDDEIGRCQEGVMRAAMDGSLWEFRDGSL